MCGSDRLVPVNRKIDIDVTCERDVLRYRRLVFCEEILSYRKENVTNYPCLKLHGPGGRYYWSKSVLEESEILGDLLVVRRPRLVGRKYQLVSLY